MEKTVAASPTPSRRGDEDSADRVGFIEHWLIIPKILYVMLNLFVYSTHSLLFILFHNQWGFPYYMYGLATTITAVNFFGAMIWSSLADRTGKYKAIIVTNVALYTVVACWLISLQRKGATEELSSLMTIAVFVGFGLFNFFLSAAFPLVDALILGMLSSNSRVSRDQFGNQRMFGAVGHWLATFISLLLVQDYGSRGVIIYQIIVSVVFILVIFLGVKDAVPIKGGHHHQSADKNKNQVSPSPSPLNDSNDGKVHQVPLAQAMDMAPTPAPPSAIEELAAEGQAGQRNPVLTLLTDPNFLFFMLLITCLGVVRSVSSSFQKPLVDALLRKGKTPPGVTLEKNYVKLALPDIARMVSEMLAYMTAKPMKRFMGIYWLLILSQLTGIFRIFAYAILNPAGDHAYAITWLIELTKGFSSGMVSSSAIPIASRIAPPGCENSAQGLFSGNYSGLSMGLGGIIAGGILRFHYFEGCGTDVEMVHIRSMFLWVAIGSLIVTILMTLKYIFVDRVVGIPGFPRRRSV